MIGGKRNGADLNAERGSVNAEQKYMTGANDVQTRFVVTALQLGVAVTVHAQSLMYRPPNLGGTWVPDGGVVQFNFVHRFYVFPAPSHTVVNYPSFTLALGLGRQLGLGWHFGTHTVIQGVASSNESEFYARYRWGAPEGVDGYALALTPAYNAAAKSIDGELGADWTSGPITLTAAARALQKPLGLSGHARAAFAGGFVARLSDYVAVSADAGSLVGPTTVATWGAALSVVIPGSPHTFSLQTSNAAVNTIQGNSRGTSQRRYGFEFTIPLHLSRFAPWFHKPTPPALGATGPAAQTVEVRGFHFRADTVTIRPGETVRWVNADPLEHTITFADGPDSGRLVQHASFARRFDQPGTYTYHCTPHPYMQGVVVVR
jgi:plastocyanin